MRKWIALLLSLALVLSLAACSKQKNSGAEESTSVSGVTDPAEELVEQGDSSADVSFLPVDASAFDDDGTMLLDCSYIQPTIDLPDKKVQRLIQEDLDGELEAMMELREEYIQASAQEYDDIGADSSFAMVDDNGNYLPYYLHMETRVTRCDEKVLSILFQESLFTHGAHGGSVLWGCNYDVTTGERVRFDALGKEFRSTAEKLALARADEIAAEGINNGEGSPFYPDYADQITSVVLDGTETLADLFGYAPEEGEESPLMSPTFYFTPESIVFISGEYCLQPYAAGIIELDIPYDQFGDKLDPVWLP